MTTYVVGDVHGHWEVLRRALAEVGWSPHRDHLLSVGDLVNRGPASGEVLRFFRDNEGACSMVLGNHELHLLACWLGERKPGPKDTAAALLTDDDDDTLPWLSRQPLLLDVTNAVIVHAALPHGVPLDEARARARRLEEALRDPRRARPLLAAHDGRGGRPAEANAALAHDLAVFTRARACRVDGTYDWSYKGPVETLPETLRPWFALPQQIPADLRVCFGHWAALGARKMGAFRAMDAGLSWGRSLALLSLDDDNLLLFPATPAREGL